ncbi:tumor necrosis factor receptor superfamily member 9 isoform X1 [Pogona vitticeps]
MRCLLALLLPGLLWSRELAPKPPCEEGTFREAPWQNCVPCDLCDGDHREYERRCNGTANALCRCRPGFLCGGNACERCLCSAGQEPTAEGCRSCPKGTFNNQSHAPCRPWTRCPEGHILTPGTEKTDVVCRPGLEEPGTTAPPGVVSTQMRSEETDSRLLAVILALLGVLLLCLVFLLLSCVFFRSWARETFRKGPPKQLAQEVDDCVYRYPEEEEGEGSGTPCLKGELLLEKGP